MDSINTIRRRNWLYEVIVCIEMLIIVAIGCVLVKPLPYGMMSGALLYLALANVLRGIFLKHHRKGIGFMNRRQYTEAIEAFMRSNRFFTQYERIDKYRYITMFMSSLLSYRQMSLFNIANCYVAKAQPHEAKMYFEQFLLTSPPGDLAQRAEGVITMIDEAVKNQATEIPDETSDAPEP